MVNLCIKKRENYIAKKNTMTRLIIVCISGVLPEHLSANQSTIFKVGLDKGQVPFLYLGLMSF